MDQPIAQLIDDFKAYYSIYGVMLWEHNIPEGQRIVAKDLADRMRLRQSFRYSRAYQRGR